jgi:hypothetical protein
MPTNAKRLKALVGSVAAPVADILAALKAVTCREESAGYRFERRIVAARVLIDKAIVEHAIECDRRLCVGRIKGACRGSAKHERDQFFHIVSGNQFLLKFVM